MALHREREEDVEAALNKGSLWAITYGDLMSYLMIFFLILFVVTLKGGDISKSLSQLQSQFGGEKTSEAIERMESRSREQTMADQMKNRLHDRGLEKFATVEVTQHRIQITLREPILFNSGGADMKKEAWPLLHEFAQSVQNLPNTLVIEGHTDDVPVRGGKYADNWELSTARANSVIRHLVVKEGLDPHRISGTGYAEFRPAAENSTPEGRAANRRIEMYLMRKE